MITRRELIAGLVWVGAMLPQYSRAGSTGPIITMLGDSITAGYGLASEDALPAQLQTALTQRGVKAIVRAAGVSGDTTAGGLARLDFSVQKDTTLCIVELGANDYFQSVDPKQIRANLTQIGKRLKARGMGVLVLGGRLPRAGNGSYSPAFTAAFDHAAQDAGVALLPDFISASLDKPGLRQADGIHPSAAGVKILANRLAPTVIQQLSLLKHN